MTKKLLRKSVSTKLKKNITALIDIINCRVKGVLGRFPKCWVSLMMDTYESGGVVISDGFSIAVSF